MACNCLQDMNKLLAEHNGRVCETIMWSTGDVRPTLMIEKIKPRGKQPPAALPSFCPFCGVAYKNKEAAA